MELISAVVSWPTLLLATLIFGFTPGFTLRMIVRIYPKDDPRRQELISELYTLGRFERMLFVAEQCETVLFEGLPHRVKAVRRSMRARRKKSRSVEMPDELAPSALDSIAGRGNPGLVQGVWQRLATNVVHRSPAFEVRADAVVRPDGGHGTYTHVVMPGSVTVLAIDGRDLVVLTRKWVYTHGGTEWRLPCGAINGWDEEPQLAARRCLLEHTGLVATSWELLAQLHGADDVSNNVDHVFLAAGLSVAVEEGDPQVPQTPVRTMPFEQAFDLVEKGLMPHAGSAHAVLAVAVRRALG